MKSTLLLSAALALALAAMAGAATGPPVHFTLFAQTDLPLGQAYWTGREWLWNAENDGKIEAAGADVLFAPGLPDLAAVKKVTSAIGKPFNFMVGIKGRSWSKAELEAAGVKRISVGGAMARVAMAAFLKCAREMKDHGAFTYVREMAPIRDVREGFAKGAAAA